MKDEALQIIAAQSTFTKAEKEVHEDTTNWNNGVWFPRVNSRWEGKPCFHCISGIQFSIQKHNSFLVNLEVLHANHELQAV